VEDELGFGGVYVLILTDKIMKKLTPFSFPLSFSHPCGEMEDLTNLEPINIAGKSEATRWIRRGWIPGDDPICDSLWTLAFMDSVRTRGGYGFFLKGTAETPQEVDLKELKLIGKTEFSKKEGPEWPLAPIFQIFEWGPN